MLDKSISLYFKKQVSPVADWLIQHHVTATQITLIGFAFGLLSAWLIIIGQFILALISLLANRACDGLDGLIAYKTSPTETGAYLDILLDFFFYSAIPFAFIIHSPEKWGLPAGLLIYCFVLTGASFLIAAIFAEKHQINQTHYQKKAFYYSLGLIEASETTLFFGLLLCFPDYFHSISYLFAGLCLLTVFMRVTQTLHWLKQISTYSAEMTENIMNKDKS